MALTFTKGHCDLDTALGGTQSGQYLWVGEITFDGSYPTGGEVLAATDFHSEATAITDHVLVGDDGDSLAFWDGDNSKIILYNEGLTQESDTSDQSTVSVRVQVFLTR